MKYADLHLHTYFSDGTYSPQELVSQSLKAGLACIAVADHDTVEAIGPALELGRNQGLEVLPGIELSAEYEGTEVHILGYLIDYQQKELTEKLEVLRQNRIARVHKIVAKLKEMGVDLDAEKIFGMAQNGGTVGRLHIARIMLQEGFINSLIEAFQKYIGDKSPAYVAGFKLNSQEAIALIRGCGGVSVLAHPYTLRNDELIPELVRFGLMGLEAYYPEHSQAIVNFYLALAQKYNLLVTGGSDCHGQAKAGVKIGAIKIPYALVEKIKVAQEKLK